MQIDLIVEEHVSRLSLSGDFSLIDIEQIKCDLVAAIDSAQRICIDTKALTAIDVACLQLLHAARLSAMSKGKELVIHSNPAEAFTRQIVRAGLIQGQDGGNKSESEGFWNEGGD